VRHGGGNRVEGGLHGRCWARLRDGNACAGMDSSDEDDEDGMGMEVIEDDEDAMVETKAKKTRAGKGGTETTSRGPGRGTRQSSARSTVSSSGRKAKSMS
jgi:hypothetical protein